MPKFQNIKVVHRYLKQGRKTNSEWNARTGNKLRNLALFFRFRSVSFSKIEKTFSKSLKSLLKVLLRQLSKCFCGSNYVSVIRNPCFNDLNVETNRSAKSAEKWVEIRNRPNPARGKAGHQRRLESPQTAPGHARSLRAGHHPEGWKSPRIRQQLQVSGVYLNT